MLLQSHGVKVFETLLFDLDQGSISIYIDEINMHHKIRLRDDPRIDSVLFFEEHMTVVAHLKNREEYKGAPAKQQEQREQFLSVQHITEFQKNFQKEEILTFRIFDRVKVIVETTTEFPLDIKCTLVFTKEDLEKYENLKKEQEAKAKQVVVEKEKVIETLVEEKLNDEV